MRILTALFVLLTLSITALPVRAHDRHPDHGAIGSGDVTAALRKAHDQFHGPGGVPAAKATLVALAARLAAAPSTYNTWVQNRVNRIVQAVNESQVHEAETQLHDVIEILARPPLTKPVLKKAGMGFHDILHSATPDAARRCETAIRAYVDTLRPDTSTLSVWAQRRLDDIVGAFAAGQTAAAEERLHAMLASL